MLTHAVCDSELEDKKGFLANHRDVGIKSYFIDNDTKSCDLIRETNCKRRNIDPGHRMK